MVLVAQLMHIHIFKCKPLLHIPTVYLPGIYCDKQRKLHCDKQGNLYADFGS